MQEERYVAKTRKDYGRGRKTSKHGFKEIILSGIDIASYGFDLEGKYNLTSILEEIDKVEGIERIRIGSIDPTFLQKKK